MASDRPTEDVSDFGWSQISLYVAMADLPISVECKVTADPTGSFFLTPNGLTHKAIFWPCTSYEKA